MLYKLSVKLRKKIMYAILQQYIQMSGSCLTSN